MGSRLPDLQQSLNQGVKGANEPKGPRTPWQGAKKPKSKGPRDQGLRSSVAKEPRTKKSMSVKQPRSVQVSDCESSKDSALRCQDVPRNDDDVNNNDTNLGPDLVLRLSPDEGQFLRAPHPPDHHWGQQGLKCAACSVIIVYSQPLKEFTCS